jgi:hypothetical protein
MAAVRLRVIFRTVITDSRPLTLHNIPVAPLPIRGGRGRPRLSKPVR